MLLCKIYFSLDNMLWTSFYVNKQMSVLYFSHGPGQKLNSTQVGKMKRL